jgi:hypothetical protein
MQDRSRSFLDFVSSTWQEHERELFDAGFRSQLKQSEERKTLGIEVEGPRQLASVQAWEYANCLDVVVMELPTKNSRILSAGPCSSFADAQSRLAALRAILLEIGP